MEVSCYCMWSRSFSVKGIDCRLLEGPGECFSRWALSSLSSAFKNQQNMKQHQELQSQSDPRTDEPFQRLRRQAAGTMLTLTSTFFSLC
ncbi:hypothetical protein EYF80_028356 [Liparis tanakae]|uniref:Uncharacterized protein n=1 Tax=Liparis tanakae TaxID=230148 RepID=A0A4Z2H6F2_9TELE|nr:hypothetical protein EYF80_028356 [Liparis tanakae]